MDSKNSQNDRDASFVAQLTSNQQNLLIYVRGLMPGDGNADDVLQRANAKIWEKRNDFEMGTCFRAWAMAVARFEVLNYRKQLARDSRMMLSDDLEQKIASELVKVQDNLDDRRSALESCLNELEDSSRQMLLSRYSSRLPVSELAKHFGRTAGGLRVALSRLRTKLTECIEAKLQSSGGRS